MRDQFRAYIQRGTGLVDDHHRLAPTLAEFFADKTRQRVGKTAGGQRHNDGYRMAGEMRLCGSHNGSAPTRIAAMKQATFVKFIYRS